MVLVAGELDPLDRGESVPLDRFLLALDRGDSFPLRRGESFPRRRGESLLRLLGDPKDLPNQRIGHNLRGSTDQVEPLKLQTENAPELTLSGRGLSPGGGGGGES